MAEIIDDKSMTRIDEDLDGFLAEERRTYARLVDRGMVTPEQLQEMTWRSAESVTEQMGAAEVFALLAAVARQAHRFGDAREPFHYAFELGFEGRLKEIMAGEGDGPELLLDALRLYAKDALWFLVDRELEVNKVWDRAYARDAKKKEKAA
jgi:hypothetical protein